MFRIFSILEFHLFPIQGTSKPNAAWRMFWPWITVFSGENPKKIQKKRQKIEMGPELSTKYSMLAWNAKCPIF